MQYYQKKRRVQQLSYSLQKQNKAIFFLNSCVISHEKSNFLGYSSLIGKIEIITHYKYITHTMIPKAYTC